MIVYKCDHCGEESIFKPEITISGVKGTRTPAGILIPPSQTEQCFCDINCFRAWVEQLMPDKNNDLHYEIKSLKSINAAQAETIKSFHNMSFRSRVRFALTGRL
jgi:hypothetical protein